MTPYRMFKKAVQQGRRRVETGGVPPRGTLRISMSRERSWRTFSTSCKHPARTMVVADAPPRPDAPIPRLYLVAERCRGEADPSDPKAALVGFPSTPTSVSNPPVEAESAAVLQSGMTRSFPLPFPFNEKFFTSISPDRAWVHPNLDIF